MSPSRRAGKERSFSIRGMALGPAGFAWRAIGVTPSGLTDASEAGREVWSLNPRQVLVPAFHDHHTHLVGTFRPARGPDLSAQRTRAGALAAVEAWLQANAHVAPVLGEGWDESSWDDPRPLTRDDLDRIGDPRPIGLRRVCGHLAVLNAAAWHSLEPRGPESDPATGTIVEMLALGLAARWPAPREDYLEGARAAQAAALREGVLGADEMGRPETYRGFLDLEAAGGLRLLVRHYFPIAERERIMDEGVVPGTGSARVRVVGLKGFLDGSFGARTAAVGEPYADRDTRGMLLWESGDLLRHVRDGVADGWAVALHAIGDRAVDQALGVFEAVRAEGRGDALLRIEHAELLTPGLLDRARQARVHLSMQPNFTARWQQPGGMYDAALGPRRARGLNPFGSALRRGHLLFGSDTMPFGPLQGLPGALAHPDPGERLDLGSALRAYARDGVAGGAAARNDPLAPGSPADLVVIESDAETLAHGIVTGQARVVWTCASGSTVHVDAGADVPGFLVAGAR